MNLELLQGDSNMILGGLRDAGVMFDSIVTDPPYYLESVAKRFGKASAAPAKEGADGRFTRQSSGFIGQTWDTADEDGYRIAQDPAFWRLCFEVLKPGAFCLAFSSPRTGHRQACAMEDAGFIMHPMINWISTGFPKPHSFDRNAEKRGVTAEGAEGWYHSTQTLRPASEPIYVGQRPYDSKTALDNWFKHGVGGMNVEATRTPEGKWPTNVIHDDAPETRTDLAAAGANPDNFNRFPAAIYTPKANKTDRDGSNHPTVKPVELMGHLIRLVTPPGGRLLDPFAGSGTTGTAAVANGMGAVLIERDERFFEGLERRFNVSGD